MSIWTQTSALIQLRTSLRKFDDLAEKSEKSSVSNFSTKVRADARASSVPALHDDEALAILHVGEEARRLPQGAQVRRSEDDHRSIGMFIPNRWLLPVRLPRLR